MLATLKNCLGRSAPAGPGDHLLIAFSGGPDSTALLVAMRTLARERGLRLTAAHIDHAMDPRSGARASAARALCATLGVPFMCRRQPVGSARHPGESPEAAARRVRYAALETLRNELRARWTFTAHHRDDQAETVVMRLLFGTGLRGLAGIAPRRGHVVRPLLEIPRERLREVLPEGLAPVEDPTNRDLATPRNRVRHCLLPALRRTDPDLDARLAALAATVRRALPRIEAVLARRLALRGEAIGASLDLTALRELPDVLWPLALALLHHTAGRPYPPSEAARRELRRQVRCGRGVGCDCGAGWTWTGSCHRLWLTGDREAKSPDFAYTLTAPGEIEVALLGLRFRLRRGPVEAWMFTGAARRAGLVLPLLPGEAVVVRNRRPGDRIQPLGCRHVRRLKAVLIDRRIPRSQRHRIPLLVVRDRPVWVPGVTIDESCRIRGEATVWIAELEAVGGVGNPTGPAVVVEDEPGRRRDPEGTLL